MAPPKGHKYWQFMEYPGRPRKYPKPRDLWKAACSYFDWTDETPINELKHMVVDKDLREVEQPRPRAMTITALCRHIGITQALWCRWKKERDDEYVTVMNTIEEVIRDQKFTYAAVGMMNSTLISRDLGLADKQELSGPSGKPIELETTTLDPSNLSSAALKEVMAAFRASSASN